MKGYVVNLREISLENDNFRKVLYTSKHLQLVVMTIPPNGEIGEETHDLDQFIRIEEGEGKAVLNDVEHAIEDGSGVVVPAGTKHNFINTSSTDSMRLFTVYGPPDHKDGIVHKTKADADAHDQPFDGVTTE